MGPIRLLATSLFDVQLLYNIGLWYCQLLVRFIEARQIHLKKFKISHVNIRQYWVPGCVASNTNEGKRVIDYNELQHSTIQSVPMPLEYISHVPSATVVTIAVCSRAFKGSILNTTDSLFKPIVDVVYVSFPLHDIPKTKNIFFCNPRLSTVCWPPPQSEVDSQMHKGESGSSNMRHPDLSTNDKWMERQMIWEQMNEKVSRHIEPIQFWLLRTAHAWSVHEQSVASQTGVERVEYNDTLRATNRQWLHLTKPLCCPAPPLS